MANTLVDYCTCYHQPRDSTYEQYQQHPMQYQAKYRYLHTESTYSLKRNTVHKQEYRRIPIYSLLNSTDVDPITGETIPCTDLSAPTKATIQIHMQCSEAGHKVNSTSASRPTTATDQTSAFKRRSKWSPDQDTQLLELVNKHGAKDWKYIASFFPGRRVDNARLRYKYFLRFPKEVRTRPFSEEEDEMIVKETMGAHEWKRIGREMGRSCGAVRNRSDVLKRLAKRQERVALRRQMQAGKGREDGSSTNV